LNCRWQVPVEIEDLDARPGRVQHHQVLIAHGDLGRATEFDRQFDGGS
jgi:hypothetical protein